MPHGPEREVGIPRRGRLCGCTAKCVGCDRWEHTSRPPRLGGVMEGPGGATRAIEGSPGLGAWIDR